MIDSEIVVKQGATIPDGSICSKRAYDIDARKFSLIQHMEDRPAFSELLENGVITLLPRELQLKEYEVIGGHREIEEESDLDLDLEESEADPEEQFIQEAEEMFHEAVENQKVQ